MRLASLLFLAVLLPAFGAAPSASLHGQVKDESGALVPGATITLLAPDGAASSTQADGVGAYTFADLKPANYSVSASAPKLVLRDAVAVSLKAGPQTLDLHLKVVDVVQELNVEGNSGPTVSTASAENSSALVLRGQDLDALSDNPDDLAADLQALAGPSAGPNGGSTYIDGFSGGEIPPKNSIREIRINQNPFSPEYDKLGYGRIDIFTKPGSDRYRGTINYNIGSDVFNSRNPYSATKAPFLLNEFEGDAGGPLGKRASFIVDAQRNVVDNGSITNAVIVDPNSFAINRFTSTIVSPQALSRVNPRVDYQLNQNNTLSLRYAITHGNIQDAGIGAFDLISRGYHTQYTNQTVQLGETAVRGALVNETRFQYYRTAIQTIANNAGPEIRVLGSFNGGGSQLGRSFDTQDSYELQNYTSVVKGSHLLRGGVRLRAAVDDNVSPQNFNGTFTFAGGALEPELGPTNQPLLSSAGQFVLAPITSVESYRRTLLFQQLGYSPAQIRALGGGATQFTLTAGVPQLSVKQMDAAIFAGDEWRVRPNITLNLGFRYEAQTNISDWRDIAPRLAIAWAPGSKSHSKTVIRAGFGMFYDRFALVNVLAAERYNGVVQQQYVVGNPDFFPLIPSSAVLSQFGTAQSTEHISSDLKTPYIVQSALTLERQLPGHTTAALTYSNSHAVHEYKSRDINAPIPGTYNQADPNSGTFPLGHPGPEFLMESSGLYNQNQLIANMSTRAPGGVSLFGFYVFNKAMSNTDGFSTSPANPYNFSGEYGPALTDVRHRLAFGGSITTRWNVRLSPFVILQSGMPFDITSGNDAYGTTVFNARPGFATDSSKGGLVATSYGLLDPNPSPDERLVPRNYGRGPAQITLNMRLAKTIGFGGEREGASKKKPQSAEGHVDNVAAAVTGRGLGSLMRAPTTSRRYNLTLALSARNILNHSNPGPITGNITSPLFGQANQIAGTPNGEGFYETANNRRLEWQLRFTF